MKCLSLVCLFLVVVYEVEGSPLYEGWDEPGEDKDKVATSEKVPESLPEWKDQDRAKEEKSLIDFLGYDLTTLQRALVKTFKPQPIVDTASKSELLAPNEGSSTVEFLGNAVVRGTETLSRALNTVIDVPKRAITKLSAGATQALNQLGAYLVGL